MKVKLRAARVNADLTLDEAAKALGITKSTLINYEKYRTTPNMEMGAAMASLYGATVNDLIFFPDNCALSTTK